MVILIGDGLAFGKAGEDENIGPPRTIGTTTLVTGDEVQHLQMG